jgi:D-sedoheptulose 7-phosphate isomerase
MSFSETYLEDTKKIYDLVDPNVIEEMANELSELRKRNGRLFFIGSGGGAGHASHAVCDFRKISNIECYTPTDNVSELTARVNDDGWDTSYVNWLKVSKFSKNDALFVFSVGGGSLESNVSVNLVNCIKLANDLGSKVFGVVGRDGGYTKESSNLVIVVPTMDPKLITPHTEGCQAVVWHLLVSHPLVAQNEMKWESIK